MARFCCKESPFDTVALSCPNEVRLYNTNYHLQSGITINRKMLADLAVTDANAFTQLAEISKKA